jgi:hypothetical protein
VLDPAPHRRGGLRRAGPPGTYPRRDWREGGSVRRHIRDLRVPQPRIPDHPTPGSGRDRADDQRRRRAAGAGRRGNADLRVPLGVLRLPSVTLRGHQCRGDALSLWGIPGEARRRRDRHRGRHSRLGYWSRHRVRQRRGRTLPPALREVYAYLASQLHAAGPAGARPGGPHEADPDPRADRGQPPAVLRGLDRARHPAQGHHPADLRVRRRGSAHAARLPTARLRLQVPQLLPFPLRARPRRTERGARAGG